MKNKSGVPYPIHVQKLIHSEIPCVSCQNKDCNIIFGISSLSERKEVFCQHLRDVDDVTEFPQVTQLEEEDIRNVAEDESISVTLKDETVESCISLIHSATAASKQVAIPWIFTGYIHISVYDGNRKHHNSFHHRYVVTYNRSSGQFDCVCSRQKYICIHKAFALCFLKKENLLTVMEAESFNLHESSTGNNAFLC